MTYYFQVSLICLGNFPCGECPCVGQKVGQTKFEFEINHWVRYVNQTLVLPKSPLHPVWKSMTGAHGRFIFIVTMMQIKNLGLHSDFSIRKLWFNPRLEFLNRTMMHQGKNCIWLFYFLFASFDWFREKYLVVNNKFLIIFITA